jgi:hypothetical protein
MQFTFGTAPASAPSPPAPIDRLGELSRCLARWRLVGLTATQMIARLHGILDRLDALPAEESHRWERGAALYTRLRYGPPTTPVAPHVWPWRHGVKGWLYAGHHQLIAARAALLALDGAGRMAAHRRWGTLTEGGLRCNGLFRHGWPVDALAALDLRATEARVDIIPLALAGKLAQWDEGTIAPQRGARRTRGTR